MLIAQPYIDNDLPQSPGRYEDNPQNQEVPIPDNLRSIAEEPDSP